MINPSTLKPYKSFILSRVRPGNGQVNLIKEILDEIIVCMGINSPPDRKILHRVNSKTEGDITFGLLHYRDTRTASWTFDESIRDRVNHLVVVCEKHEYLAIYVSESNYKHIVVSRIMNFHGKGLGALEIIPMDILNAAFVQGPARTLWLSGTHRRTLIKADNKILAGLNLRYALDPLDDQTFHFTAARCLPESGLIDEPVGVSPRKSQVWLGPSRDWTEFVTVVGNLLSQVENTKIPIREPLPIVAISSIDSTKVSLPYDIALMPPELLADDPTMDKSTKEEIELWGYHSCFQIVESTDSLLRTEVFLKNQLLGELRFNIKLTQQGQVYWDVSVGSYLEGKDHLLAKALQLSRRRLWLKIWFESGHTVSGGELFEVRHRDMPFGDFVWAKLKGDAQGSISYLASREKPSPLSAIGTQNSLFDWMAHHWPDFDRSNNTPGGWLSSDDGAMEIADFIHLDDQVHPPVLNLIHVKGSGSDSEGRGISVSDYEVVVGQAVKNLRYVDRIMLSEGLAEGIGKKVSNLVWYNRQSSTREKMINAITKVSSNYRKCVYVFQPRMTRSMFNNARMDKKGSAYARLRQLDTLLLSASASSKGLGVDFFVIGDDI